MNLKNYSLLAVLLFAIHVIDDFAHERIPVLEAVILVPVIAIWLGATLKFTDQRAGMVVMILGSLVGLAAPILHAVGPRESLGFLTILNLLLLGFASLATLVLATIRLLATSKVA